MTNKININLNQIKEISLNGIRRTSVFLGFGVNAARSSENKEFQLTDETPFRFIPEDLDKDKIDHFKEHFEHWIVCCGLRELIETFSVFLCSIYKVCLLTWIHKNRGQIKSPEKSLKSFEWKGVEKQLKSLRHKFSVETPKESYIRTINQIRNCLTHRRGIVGNEDLKGNRSLKTIWWSLDPFIEIPSGEIISMAPPYPKEGIFLKDGGKFSVKVVEREREFKKGEVIRLSPNDLSEIIFLMTMVTDEISLSTFHFLKKSGIDIKET